MNCLAAIIGTGGIKPPPYFRIEGGVKTPAPSARKMKKKKKKKWKKKASQIAAKVFVFREARA